MLMVLGCPIAGCAARQQTCAPETHEPIVFPIELEGPACREGGPSVEIVHARRFQCGKGDTCTMLDERIRNPTDGPLWLLLEQPTVFSRSLDSVTILHARYEGSPAVWAFDGQNYNEAFRVPRGGDVVARNLAYTNPLEPFGPFFWIGSRCLTTLTSVRSIQRGTSRRAASST